MNQKQLATLISRPKTLEKRFCIHCKRGFQIVSGHAFKMNGKEYCPTCKKPIKE